MRPFNLPPGTIVLLRNRIRSFRIAQRMRAGLFVGLVFCLLLASGIPAVHALRNPTPYIKYQDGLIDFFDSIVDKAGSVSLPSSHADVGVRIEALTKLMGCGFVLVLMWKGIHRRPVRAMILFIAFVALAADPPLIGFLGSQPSTGTVPLLWAAEWAAESVEPFVVASLLRFAVLFPRPLTTAELLPRLSDSHPGMVRRAWRQAMAIGRHSLPRTAFLQVPWPDAAVLLALVSFAAVTRAAGWPWVLNSYLFGAAIVFVIARLATTLRVAMHTSRSGVPVGPSFQIGPALVGVAAAALLIQPGHGWVDSTARLALIAFLISGGKRMFSRMPSAIGWFDAAIVLALATFMFLTWMTDWAWRRNYQVAAAAAVIVVTRLAVTALKLWIRKGRREYFSRPSLAGPLLIAVYALAVATQPRWASAARPVEMVIVVVTIALLPWMLRGTLGSYLPFSDLQLGLARPFPVWSAALVAYFVALASVVSITTMGSVAKVSPIGPLWLWGVVSAAALIGGLVALVIIVGLLFLAIKFLRIGYEVGDASDRQRVLWIVEGVAVATAIQLVTVAAAVVLSGAAPPDLIAYGRRLASSLNLPILLLSLGVAIFYHGALEPSLIIRRTTVYSAVFVVSAFLFEALENAISTGVLGTKEPPGWVASMIAAGSVALAFGPIRRRCEALVARYLPAISNAAAEPTRRTAVIVMTDLVGYSATTLDDERGAGAMVARLRQVVKEAAGAGGGRVIEWSRDLALLEFPDAATAVTACRRMFERFHGARDTSGASRARLRAGVHTGDVLFAADGGVTGRAVIIADRLRERASGGEILLSHTAMAGLPKVLGYAVEDLGTTKLRDVPEPQECFRLRTL